MTSRRLLALAYKGVARAEQGTDGQWVVEQVLAGQDVRCLEVNPLNPEVVYAGTQGQGVLRSEDGGRSWRPLGLQGVIVKSLAASPHQPGVVYAGTKRPPLIYRTQNGGADWEELTGFRRVRGRWLWLSPAEPPFTAYVIALGISPSDPTVVLAGVELGAVVRSADAGQTWKQPKEGLDRRYCINVAADAERPEIWYAVVAPTFKAHSANSQAVVVRSTGGAPWKKLGGGLPDTFDRLPLLASDPVAPGQLYLASGHGEVWHSTDYGDTWRRLPLNLGEIWFRLIVA